MSGKDLTFCDNSISVYIHWPYCLKKCPYCDFNSYVFTNNIEFDLWQKAYISEIEKQSEYLQGKNIKTVFFGGGTPSLIRPKLVESIITTINKFNNSNILEITLESNPSSIEASKLKEFKDVGVNRLSMGIQSFKDKNLEFLGRNHSVKEALNALNKANKIFDNVSFDLINGLPNQSLEDWKAELLYALPLITSHISIYELTIEPNTPFFKLNIPKVKSGLAKEIFNFTVDTLSSNNIYPYEISNYAKTGRESLHNLQYWQGGLYLGIGPGAHGRVMKNNDIYATVSYKNPMKWLDNAINNKPIFSEFYVLTKEQRLLELFILNLRLYREISPLIIKYINTEAIEFLLEKGLLTKNSKDYYLTKTGRLQLNTLIEYLSNHINL